MISDIVGLRYPNIKRWLHLTRDVCKIYIGVFYYSYRGNFQSGVWDLNLFLARNLHDIPISVHSWMNRLPFFLFTIDSENFQMCTMFITQTHTQYGPSEYISLSAHGMNLSGAFARAYYVAT